MPDFKEYKQLHKHNGSENYELKEILNYKWEVFNPSVNTYLKEILIYCRTNPADRNDRESIRLKLSVIGDMISEGITNAGPLKDGTIKGFDFYSNWIINGDTTRYKFIDPVPEEEKKNFDKWEKRFDEFYNKSSYVYKDISSYYFKVDQKWYLLKDTIDKGRPENFRKKYPHKIDPSEIRMLDLESIMPDLVAKPENLDTSLVKKVGYQSTFFEESKRGRAFNYSAGWWYLDIYMPGGDTLKVKRFASFRDPEMKLYKIPAEHGGRDDVLFIIQEPNEIHPEQVGGMYVIRPRNYTETPEYKAQQAKQEEEEEKRKQQQNKEAIKKRRSFLPDDD